MSVVIPTYERPDACERAVRSAVHQTRPALEVLVCDHGSRDDTPARGRAWEEEYASVRYLALPGNLGGPGPPRNLGVRHAAGDWVAFLDDDDEWLPDKLERQIAHSGDADVIAANAWLPDGQPYFDGMPATWRPQRRQLLRRNPVITSTAIVRRQMLLDVGGFREDRGLKVEDYALWLALADRGARFLILGSPLARYTTAGGERLSDARPAMELSIARHAWSRFRATPERDNLLAALRWTAGAGLVRIQEARRARSGGRRRA